MNIALVHWHAVSVYRASCCCQSRGQDTCRSGKKSQPLCTLPLMSRHGVQSCPRHVTGRPRLPLRPSKQFTAGRPYRNWCINTIKWDQVGHGAKHVPNTDCDIVILFVTGPDHKGVARYVHMAKPVNLRVISDSQSRRENANRKLSFRGQGYGTFATYCHTPAIPIPRYRYGNTDPPPHTFGWMRYWSLGPLYDMTNTPGFEKSYNTTTVVRITPSTHR